jgi:Zn finger protein HypA/HybF involved in hydrogenase expression
MTGFGPSDRRFRAKAPSLTPECRLCWRTVVLDPQHVEVTDQHVYVRCPHCGGSFPIRHSDTAGMPGYEASTAG